MAPPVNLVYGYADLRLLIFGSWKTVPLSCNFTSATVPPGECPLEGVLTLCPGSTREYLMHLCTCRLSDWRRMRVLIEKGCVIESR